MKKRAMRARRRRATMAAVAACAVMVVTGAAADANEMPRFIAGTKAVIEAADSAMPRPKMPGRAYAPEIMTAHTRARRLNANRALDWRLRELYHAHFVSAKNIADLRRCISVADLARATRSWHEAAQRRLREIDSVILFAWNGHPTLEVEILWEDHFRNRIRREGALMRILEGTIIPSRCHTGPVAA